ncbi:hypothetical protein [Ekhidna sp.]
MKGYSVFRKFLDSAQASEITNLLLESDIDTILKDNSPSVDVTFSGNELQNEILLYVRQEHFTEAEKLLEKEALDAINNVDSDHYLFSFSNEELSEIVLKPDEWSAFDLKLAQKLLNERGVSVSNQSISEIKAKRNEELGQQDSLPFYKILLSYLSVLAGGLPGIFFGYILMNYKKTLPNGQKVYGYDSKTRKAGNGLFWFAIPFTLFEWYLFFQ